MNVDEAIAVLRKKLRHVTREYRPEDQALDVIAKALRPPVALDELRRKGNLQALHIESERRCNEIIELYRKAQEDNVIMPFHLVMHD